MARFVRECIDGARNDPELFYTDIGVRFRLEQFLTFALGEEVYNSFWPLVRAIDRKVLITLDGFDTAFDEFRVTSIRSHDQGLLRSRAFFEIDWLRSLMGLAIRMKSSVDNYLYSILDFCLVAPMDRFMEVVHIERDSYRNWSRWFTIQWTGI